MANVIFVDENDEIIGYGKRSEAIEKGLAHRVARLFVFNKAGELLIQKRSHKIKLSGKWDQSAAGHVDEGEDYLTAAKREAEEEIGLKNAPLEQFGKYYTEEVDEDTLKKRFNMLYLTRYDDTMAPIAPDDHEVSEIKWVNLNDLTQWMAEKPQDFTQGFLLTYQYYTSHKNA